MERTLYENEDNEEEIFYSPERTEEKKQESEDITHSTNHEEKKKINDLRDRVEKKDPACKEVDDLTLRRFLRARDFDIERAAAMLMKYLTWRQKFVPTGSIAASETPNQIAHNKVFMQGIDKRGSPVAVIHGAKHFPKKIVHDE